MKIPIIQSGREVGALTLDDDLAAAMSRCLETANTPGFLHFTSSEEPAVIQSARLTHPQAPFGSPLCRVTQTMDEIRAKQEP